MEIFLIDIRGNNFFKGTNQEFKDTIAEVSKVCEKFIIVFGNEVRPKEHSILVFRSVYQQIIAPNFWRNSCSHRVITKHSCVARFRKFLWFTSLLINFIIEEFRGAYCVKLCPWFACGNQSWGEDHSVESNVILAHKLE